MVDRRVINLDDARQTVVDSSSVESLISFTRDEWQLFCVVMDTVVWGKPGSTEWHRLRRNIKIRHDMFKYCKYCNLPFYDSEHPDWPPHTSLHTREPVEGFCNKYCVARARRIE